jgi:hypothetical protein
MALPPKVMWVFGYTQVSDRFFQMQGGLFHIIMAIVYFYAGQNLSAIAILVKITIAAKLLASIFLILYYLSIEPIWMVLVSGVVDFLMGIIVLILYRSLLKSS